MNSGQRGLVGDPRRSAIRKWLGLLGVIAGIVLVAIGVTNLRRLLAAPLEAQPGYVAQTVFPLILGLGLVVGGIYSLKR